jgi:PKHD-type hydroxylase
MNLRPIFPHRSDINQSNYYWFNGGFDGNEIEKIIEDSKKYEFVKATIVDEENTNKFRKSSVKWLPHDEQWSWLTDKIISLVLEANKIWDFDIHSIIDDIQYTEYDGEGGHYDWHIDIGPDSISHRKISIVIQLSDENDYVGGDLELMTGNGYSVVPRGKGNVAIFPSFLLHRVTPLTSGNRKSLVLWVGGGHYK